MHVVLCTDRGSSIQDLYKYNDFVWPTCSKHNGKRVSIQVRFDTIMSPFIQLLVPSVSLVGTLYIRGVPSLQLLTIAMDIVELNKTVISQSSH